MQQEYIDYLQECVLGCIITDGRTIESEGISAGLFTEPHRTVYNAAQAILERSGPIDAAILTQELKESGKLESVGGLQFVNKMTSIMGVLSQVDRYVTELRNVRESKFREYLAESLARKKDLSREDFAAALNTIDANEHGDVTATKICDAVQDALYRLFEPSDRKGVKTGIEKFDSQFGGISELYTIVAAYPGSGKSTFLVSLALNFAMSGKKVLLWSAEDDINTITERAIVRLAGGRDSDQLARGATKVQGLDIWIDDTAGLSASALASRCRSYVKKHGVDVILLDHLGKLREPGNSPYERATNASGKVADIQRNLGIPLIAACQLRRQKGNPTDLPGIDDLRDSGAQEADARQIILLHRPAYFYECGKIDDKPDPNEMWLVVGKSNHGKTGRLKVYCSMKDYYIGDDPRENKTEGWQNGRYEY